MIAYGARCVWWDDKSKVASKDGTSTGLPCCPECGGVLFESDEKDWWAGVDEVATTIPRYREFIEWQRGRCFPAFAQAMDTFLAAVPE